MIHSLRVFGRRKTRVRAWKFSHALLAVLTVIQTSFLGFSFMPQTVQAAALPDSAGTTDTAAVSAPVSPDAALHYACNLQLIKSVRNVTHPNGAVQPGDTLEYRIDYKNIGNDLCIGGGARIDDTIPTGLTYNGVHSESIDGNSDVPSENEPTNPPAIQFGYPFTLSGYPPANTNIQAGASMVSWDLNTVSFATQAHGAEYGHVTFQVTVPSNLPACTTTTYENTALGYANDAAHTGNPLTFTSNTVTTTVSTYPSTTNAQTNGVQNAICYGTLTVTKVVDNGNAVPSDFGFRLVGSGVPYSHPAFGHDSLTFSGITPGLSYAVEEQVVPGYHQVSNTCTDIVVTPGQAASCTIHNAIDQTHVTFLKVVDNEPNANLTPFVFTVGNHHYHSGDSDTFQSNSYSVSENNVPGYSIVGAGGICSYDQRHGITMTVGAQDGTCVIHNVRQTGDITFLKVVDNQPNADVTPFVFSTNGQQFHSGDTTTMFTGNYPLTENTVANYHFVSASGICHYDSEAEQITLNVGVHGGTCTITNHRDTGNLIVKKVDQNGTAQANVSFQIGATSYQTDSTGTISLPNINTGIYNVQETAGPAGYSFSSVSGVNCTNSNPSSATVAANATTTCTFTNNRDMGHLIVVKHVVNNNGGTAAAPSFTLHVKNGNTDAVSPFAGSEQGSSFLLPTGTYTVSEDSHAGYFQASLICNGQNTNSVSVSLTNNADHPVYCVVTNDDIVPTISLAKTGPASAVPGDTLNYTLAWSVNGDATVTNATITDPLPTNTTFVSATCGTTVGTCSASPTATSVTWSLGTRHSGETGTVTLAIKVIRPLQNNTSIVNTGSFTTTEVGPVSSTVTTIVHSAPILSITKSNDLTTFTNPGKTVNYSVVVMNSASATDSAYNVKMTDVLPAGFTYSDTGLTTRTISVGTLVPGQSVTLTYSAFIATQVSSGSYVNTATASGNNTTSVSATSTVDVRVPQVLGASTEPKLTLNKVVTPNKVASGSIVTYRVTIKNTGDADATNVVLTDTLPKWLTFLSDGTSKKIWNIGTLAAGHTRIINYDVKVSNSATSGTYKNVAVLSADAQDPLTASAPITVIAPRVLGLATTGPSSRDALIALFGGLLMAAGALLLIQRPHVARRYR